MFCHKCGAQLDEGESFCYRCGTKVVHKDDTQQPPSTAEVKRGVTLRKAASICRVVKWVSLVLLMPFWPIHINPAILVPVAAICMIVSVLGAKRPLSLSEKCELVFASILLFLLVILAFSTLSSGESGDKYVKIVKNGTLYAYPQVTVGEAFDEFLVNPKWESGLSEDKERFVNVTGGILYYGEEAELLVQFFVDEKSNEFQYNACEIDGVPQNYLVYVGLLETIYNGDFASDVNPASKGLDPQGEPDFLSDKTVIGETQSYDNEFGNIEVTLDYIAFTDKIKNEWTGIYNYPDEGNVFLWAAITVKNIGTENGDLIIAWNRVVYDDVYEFRHYDTVGDFFNIAPLTAPREGAIIFEIPTSIMESDKPLALNICGMDGKAVISFTIRPDNRTIDDNSTASVEFPITVSLDEYAMLVYYGDQDSWVVLFQDGTFNMQTNLYVGYGSLWGTYEETDWGFKFNVEGRDFYGYIGDDVEEFEMVICDYGVEYRGDTIGTSSNGSVYEWAEY